jgi:hypothetical protein
MSRQVEAPAGGMASGWYGMDGVPRRFCPSMIVSVRQRRLGTRFFGTAPEPRPLIARRRAAGPEPVVKRSTTPAPSPLIACRPSTRRYGGTITQFRMAGISGIRVSRSVAPVTPPSIPPHQGEGGASTKAGVHRLPPHPGSACALPGAGPMGRDQGWGCYRHRPFKVVRCSHLKHPSMGWRSTPHPDLSLNASGRSLSHKGRGKPVDGERAASGYWNRPPRWMTSIW